MYKKELDKTFSSYNERTLSISWYLVILSIEIPLSKYVHSYYTTFSYGGFPLSRNFHLRKHIKFYARK